MVDIYPVVQGPELGWLKNLRREHPLRASVCRIQVSKQFSNTEVPQLELDGPGLSGAQFILCEGRKDVAWMYVLVGVLVEVDVVDRLQHAASNGYERFQALELLRVQQMSERAVATLSDYVEGVSVLESVEHVGDVRVTKREQLAEFCLG